MFVLHPDRFLLPSYRISPFTTSDIAFNNRLPDDDYISKYFDKRFRNKEFWYTNNGREAINVALSYYNLKQNDIVTVLTTTENFYISNCVTSEIEKFCKWSRKIEDGTKIILVNHEFGFPFRGLPEIKETGIPIIEDCAHSFFSNDPDCTIGNIGDFVIYSFPKMFPVQIGGLLLSNLQTRSAIKSHVVNIDLRYLRNVLSYHINREEYIITKRISNYNFLKKLFESQGMTERFQLYPGTVPGVFMFRINNQSINLPGLKNYYYAHGVQCSVFYGEESFFIPVHQALNEHDMLYFYEVINSFIQKTTL
jgi:hypothetical protein